ncbi:beta-lactamase hydrolase domain-containing protein [Acinetobacter sp.]|jgi:sulfide:quinone oxidoreductase|uniref:beta-lactamase hydrolase domain-containing protein n=1 Tax=Acinetobacter sp. TaxID=472 RepID=UPI0035B32E14
MIKPLLRSVLFSAALLCSVPAMAENDSTALNNRLSVAGQMTLDKFSTLLKQHHFKSVIVNRPDQEPGNTVTVNELRNIAEKSQVSVIYQPVASGKISQTDIIEFAKYYQELPKPILMVCKSGSRSAALFHQAKAQGLLNE